MDLWDLTRLLFRRWYFSLPMLALSIMTVVLAGNFVHPDYKATGHLLLIPAPGPPVAKDEKPRPPNPWLNLGLDSLGNAAILKVTDQVTLANLVKDGLTDSVTVLMDQHSPILIVEAVGPSPAVATSTVQRVISLLVSDIQAEQRRYGAAPQDTITTLTLTDGSDVEIVTSKVKRVLIVAAGLALLLSTAVTIALDAWLRRRARKRLALAEEAELAAEESGAGPPSGPSGPRSGRHTIPSSRKPATSVDAKPDRDGINVEYQVSRGEKRRVAKTSGARAAEVAAPAEPTQDGGSEATIILPLSITPWTGREDKNGKR
jgi:hypothetical protein